MRTKKMLTRAVAVVSLAAAATFGVSSAASAGVTVCVTWPASENDHGVPETRCTNGEVTVIIYG